jgi:NADH:ubiquinone reductase (H+-translocating)
MMAHLVSKNNQASLNMTIPKVSVHYWLMRTSRPKVVVIGGGFAGLWATRALASSDCEVTLIDKQNHHLFQPLLYQVATAGLSSSDIAAPLRHILQNQPNVHVRLGEVSNIALSEKLVTLTDSSQFTFDYLLVASGATHAYFGKPEWAAHAPGLKTLDDALNIRRKLLLAFEQAEACAIPEDRDAWMHFAVIGGGPTGVELAGTLAEIARHTLKKEFRSIDPANARIRLIEAGPRILSGFPESLSNYATKQLKHLGVEVRCGTAVSNISANSYNLGENKVAAKTVLWAAGVAASPLGKLLKTSTDKAGRVLVESDLSVPNYPFVFVAGDLASVQFDGKPVPGVAPAAKQMGKHVAMAIKAQMQGKKPTSFQYQDLGNLATIGRLAAIVDIRGFKFSGVSAWIFWLAAHVFFLIGFRNRLSVLINWAWAYFSYDRHARVIYGSGDLKKDPND